MESSPTIFHPTWIIRYSYKVVISVSLFLLFHLSGMPAFISIKILPIVQGLFSPTGSVLPFLNYIGILDYL